jgi:hypothetical protein
MVKSSHESKRYEKTRSLASPWDLELDHQEVIEISTELIAQKLQVQSFVFSVGHGGTILGFAIIALGLSLYKVLGLWAIGAGVLIVLFSLGDNVLKNTYKAK